MDTRRYPERPLITEEIMNAATVQPIATHLMHKRLRWNEHVIRRYDSHVTITVLDMEIYGVTLTGRSQLRYMETIRRDITNGLMDVNIHDRKNWGMAEPRATHWC